jgi:6-phospho-beta-glucosidase
MEVYMKIAVIGGAGVRTVIFINGLLTRYKDLNIDKVVLYDINQEKLQIIGKLCKHVINRRKEELQLEIADNAVDAITGADYIVTTLRVGGDHSRVIDEQVALQEGVIGQETTGVGGFSMAVRTIPILLEYCELIKKHAPNAWIFNFTNPSGLVTQALRNAGFDRIIGICDAPSSTKFRMAKELNVNEKDLYVEFFGLNHLSWISSVKKRGTEILSDLLQDDQFLRSIQEFSMFDPELLRSIGFLPNEYLYYYYHREKALANIIKSGATRGKTIEAANVQMMKELNEIDIEADPEAALQIFLYYMAVREGSYMSIETGSDRKEEIKKGELDVPDGMGYAGVMLDCIEGLQSDEGCYLVLSVENNGCITGLEDKDVIEVTCKVSKEGIHPVPVGEVPEPCYLLIRMIKMYEKLTIKAIETNSKVTAIQALTFHPLINSYSLAKKLVDKYDEVYDGILGGNHAV